MSLDVYLTMPGAHIAQGSSGIFVREDGQNKQISREEWDTRFPGREPAMVVGIDSDDEVFSANITHNLSKMADEAGLYECLWRPDEIGVTHARQLIGRLYAGLCALESDSERFAKLNPKNGWGDYNGLVEFVANYLAACRQWPDAAVYVSR